MDLAPKLKLAGLGLAAALGGWLLFGKTAKAAPALPGTSPGTKALPGGGIAVPTPSGTVVIPPPEVVRTGNALYVTTSDPPPTGNLLARSGPGTQYPSIGYFPKDGAVEVLSAPDPKSNFVYVRGPGIPDGGAPRTIEAWASLDFLKPRTAMEV